MKFRQFLIVTFWVLTSIAYAQDAPTFPLHVEGTITNLEDTPMPGAIIQVSQNGQVIKNITTDGSGSYQFDLPLNADYVVTVTKPGHVSKKFTVSTKGVPPDRATSKFGTVEASLSLFEKMEGIDYSALNQPMNKYSYNANKENFEYDANYLNAMIASLQNIMAQQQAAIERAKQLEKNYQAAIKAGDKAFQKNDWAGAKAAYTQALGLKPNETWPKDQMTQIDKIIKEQEALNKKKEEDAKKAAEEAAKAKAEAELNAKYAAAIKKGDDAFNAKNWAAAKLGYNEAIGYKPGEQYPKDKLAAIDKAIADEAANKSKAELDAKYAAAIKKGDDAFAQKDWTNAKGGYNEALTIKANEQYPKDKLAAIDKAIADEAAAKAKAEGDAKAKAELEAKYAAAIKKGDEGFAKKDWANAKSAYNEALGYKSAEKYPKDQIAAIDKALADETAAKAKAEADKAKAEADAKAKAELEAKYAAAIKKGDEAFAAKNWPTARTGYNEALGFKPNEAYPKSQLAAIDKAIADEKANMDAAAKAKAEAELNAKYEEAIKQGDAGFTNKEWANAKAAYNKALGFKPNEKYPKDQIVAIDKTLADEAAAKAKADADAKSKAEKEAKYAAAIKKGDDGFNAKNWMNAKAGYNEALAIKPDEQYPKDRLAAIDKAIADENANKSKAELDAKYTAAVKKGDAAFAKKDWTNAKAGYNEALSVKSEEQYPKDKLAEIEKAIADELANKSKAEGDAKAKAEKDAKYAAAIKKGDDAFTKKEWVTAKEGYIEASGLKPEEQYPKVRLAAIEAQIAKEGEAKALAELKAKYDAIVKKADGLFAKKSWVEAKAAYYEALQYLPDEKYPKMQIGAINRAMSGANDPNEQKYKDAIAKADNNFTSKQYKEAKTHYEEALTYKGGDTYAKGRLLEIEKLLNSDNQVKTADRKKELLAKYPPGVTEEIINGQGVTIIQRVIVKNGDVWVYQKKVFTWGGISYFRDGSPITELIFENETKP
ncbi:MAG TPA: carboxypeptidase-like regulatory domain-containing protein [Bacteroidia bacterium]|nr:carboxypeptidase-like regulatory domain-containing protein [Bacteroidia bacterium]